jgi:hypothetical protein
MVSIQLHHELVWEQRILTPSTRQELHVTMVEAHNAIDNSLCVNSWEMVPHV